MVHAAVATAVTFRPLALCGSAPGTKSAPALGGTDPSTHDSSTQNTHLSNAALRLLEKPERVVVQVMAGIPRHVAWRERRLSFTTAHGPERLSGDWWRADTFARDYWRCTVADEGELLLYRDHHGWFLQGWYD